MEYRFLQLNTRQQTWQSFGPARCATLVFEHNRNAPALVKGLKDSSRKHFHENMENLVRQKRIFRVIGAPMLTTTKN